MVNVRTKECLYNSCTKLPSFNFKGRTPAYCKQHAEDGMVNTRSKRSSKASRTVVGASRREPTGGVHTTYVRVKREISDGPMNLRPTRCVRRRVV